ncbi:unnamed protein product [Parajaminaea phylloscopi]
MTTTSNHDPSRLSTSADAAGSKTLLRPSLSFRRLRAKSLTASSPTRPPLPPRASASHRPLPEQGKGGSEVADAPDNDSVEPPRPPTWPLKRRYCSCYCEENTYLLAEQLLSDLGARCPVGTPDPQGWVWEVWVAFVSNQDKRVLLWQQKASSLAEAGYPVIWDYHVFPIVTAQRPTPDGNRFVAAEQPLVERSTPKQRTRTLSLFRRSSASKKAEASQPKTKGLFFHGFHIPPAPDEASSLSRVGSNAPWRAWVYDVDSFLCDPAAGESGGDVPLRPVPFETYVHRTFGAFGSAQVPEELKPMFRLARSGCFLDNFASDRSHMLYPAQDAVKARRGVGFVFEQQYMSPPPPWSPIAGSRARRKGWSNNLMSEWVAMSPSRAGEGPWPSPPPELAVQFGEVLPPAAFYRGGWEQIRWRRRRPMNSPRKSGENIQRQRPHGGAEGREAKAGPENGIGEEPPSIERVTSHHRMRTLSGTTDGQRGGRVTSPLFPAYLHEVLEARAAQKRQSYLMLKVDGGDAATVSTANPNPNTNTKQPDGRTGR